MSRPRFDLLLSQGLERWMERPIQPVHLRALVAKLRDRAASVGEVADNPRFYEIALRRLLQYGAESLRSRDDLVLAARLSVPHASLGHLSLVESKEHLEPVLRRWRSRIASSIFGATLWHSVFLSYFLAVDKDTRQKMRRFLSDTLPDLDAGPASPSWVAVVHEHERLLGSSPARTYAKHWVAGDEMAIDSLRNLVKIPENSWLWQEFVKDVLNTVTALGDESFVRLVPRTVSLSDRFEGSTDSILVELLERYVASGSHRPDEVFLQRLVGAWGSPQLDLADRSHRWSQVSEEAVKLVCRWLAEDDLADFFELIKSTRALEDMDEKRFAYWMRFTGRMSYTKLVLGSTYRYSRNTDVRKFIKKREARLSWLAGSTADNIAIVMKFGDWWFVEFAQTGNACYGYSEARRPFDTARDEITIHQLKNKTIAGRHWLTHHRDWEATFDSELARVGIWPDAVQSARGGGGISRAHAPAGKAEPRGKRSVPVGDVVDELSPASRGELASLQVAIVDNRKKGGAYWIELHSMPSESLRTEMSELGFRHARARGFYR